MCGIAGIISQNTQLVTNNTIQKMTDIIAHRGPDGDGKWISTCGKVGLGHRRLSIIDLSHQADQPMHYLGRYTIVFNGEIYNYIELKDTLQKQGYTFKTQSDTEVLMALYHRDKENCLQHLDGMFAFVIHDAQENTAFCARDRFGEKPFFYSYQQGQHFYFGSEMKTLWAGGIPKKVNNKMMYNYLSFGYTENPNELSETFFDGCIKLIHSHYIKIDLNTLTIKIKKYYDIDWKKIDKSITEKQTTEKFKELFYTSVSRRLRSDVPVGSSLSGGLDSSLVVCVIDALNKGMNISQNTFSAVFPGFKKDERKYMDFVTSVTNVTPHYVTPTDEGLINDIEKLSWHQEEPFGSASIYVQYKVMELAKLNNITVLLDGQGADEILAGYHSYFASFFNELKKNNKSNYKEQYSQYLNVHSTNEINGVTKKSIGNFIRDFSPSIIKPLKRIKLFLNQSNNSSFNPNFYKEFESSIFETPGNSFSSLNESLYHSTYKYGLQQLLRFADRNSMAHSREVRLPFLSHELIDFIFTLPANFKINNGWTKYTMRNTFDILPNEIKWRKDKIGYEPPQKSWMENENFKEKIYQSRLKLISNGYINKNYKVKDIKALDAQDISNNSWIHFQAANLLN
jgi:asparagine synthase (glutamine-hydrolysing)